MKLCCIYIYKPGPSTASESLLTVLKMFLTKRTEEFEGTLLKQKKKKEDCFLESQVEICCYQIIEAAMFFPCKLGKFEL